MGDLNAAAMAEAVGEGEVALRPALAWHLQSNHYPPVPLSMVEPCALAIEAYIQAWADGEEEMFDADLPIALPDGITYKGHPAAPAQAIIEQHHLWFFIEATLYGDESYE